MKRRILAWALALLLLAGAAFAEAPLTGGGMNDAIPREAITSAAQLNDPDIKLGLPLSSAADEAVREQMPLAQLVHYNDNMMGFLDVAQGRIDAYIYDEVQTMLAIENGGVGVRMLDEFMDRKLKICVGISPVSQIPDLENKVNRFIAEMKGNGVLDDMYRRWTRDAERTLPEIDLPADPQYHLVVGTSGIVMPFSYYEGNALTGYDIELAYRFAQWMGADLEFQIYDYSAIVPAAVSGKVDVVMANLQYTDERAESGLIYSDELYSGRNAILVRDDTQRKRGVYNAISELDGKRIGIQTGTIYDDLAQQALPDASLSFFNNYSDMVVALKANKIDAFPGDELLLRMMVAEDEQLAIMDEPLNQADCAYALPKTAKGDRLRAELDAWLESIEASGELEQIVQKWYDTPESERTIPDYASFPAPNGTLTLATEAAYAPLCYYRGDQIVGMEIDLTARFCEANGYGLKVVNMNFDGILPAIQAGKADFAAAAISITEERRESVNFSRPYYYDNVLMCVLAEVATAAAGETEAGSAGGSFFDSVRGSFEKTFLRENRWQLFVQGILTTLLITALAILFGTALGFGVFMLCRNGNPAANLITRFCLWLVQGMPMVVLLMILYYIVFGSVAISGVVVAVLGFTLTFGAAVFGLLKMGVGAVDNGQYEAACALGYSNRRTFFKIILPQALPHVLPAYRGEIVSLIKAIPLIAVTVIYFVLESLIGFLVGRASVNFNPKRRKPADILKGVKTDDQN